MPHRRWRQRIEDILEAAARIAQATAGRDEAAFCADRMAVDAVCMNLIVIGEASRHVPDDIAQAHPALPWAEMRDMRNLIAHEYFGISPQIVWRTAVVHVPGIVPLLKLLLEGVEPEQ